MTRATRIVSLLPALAFLATFGFFFVDKNREARTVFRSGRGLLTIAVIIVGYVDETANRRLVAGPVAAQDTPAPAGTSIPGPVRLSTGVFRGIGHDASGSASIIRNADGALVVRFEDFDIEGVPDPRVHLIKGADVRDAGGVSLGRLTGNQGHVLDFAVPAGTDAGPGWTVLVWCRAFAVPVANATQG
jgi:hypothetical protein